MPQRDHVDRIRTTGIRKQLTKMRVVGVSELVFDDHLFTRRAVYADKIQCETPDRVFCAGQLEVHSECLAQHVCVLQQPRRKVLRLMDPYKSRIDRLETAQFWHTAGGRTHGHGYNSSSHYICSKAVITISDRRITNCWTVACCRPQAVRLSSTFYIS